MSSNIRINRICQQCGSEFEAKTTVTQFCSDRCAKHNYKARKRVEKVKASHDHTKVVRQRSLEEIKSKEILTVSDVAKLLTCSTRTVYNLINNGTLNGIKFSERKTLLRRSDIERFFDNALQPLPPRPEKPLDIKQCYHMGEIQLKYNVSEKALYDMLKRNNIQKTQRGKFVYVLKSKVDQLLNPKIK
ncbi:helix-turn-helix transcriptional regulator [Mucilaginibacter sp. E4BP6]|uniref:helix-turn-helix transcriptional regulator n=1 Tax=Mucilaginibacter sp. E4BP6 TaxID=2723089 RepID=UPI0015CBF61D|nr:helix-turn-helix domain-containing protein [Mucilaginibacter sp. E4BP6]NYE64979.1 excisionase family DNA binding protein [Mucilaginibacter sp. E4BP6]